MLSPVALEGVSSRAVPGRPVIVVGIAGLRWTDISASTTPAIWRLASAGAAGTLAATTINPVTCPADFWLTLNSGARAAAKPGRSGQCQPLPAVQRLILETAGPAYIPAMRGLIGYNKQFSYGPAWGVLAQSAGRGRCSTAIGPGAALALASPAGDVSRYLPTLPGASRVASGSLALRQCPLTVIDLGALPSPGAASASRHPAGRTSARPSRMAAIRADDLAVGRIAAVAPAGAVIMLTSAGDAAGPRLGVIVISGPGYRTGLVTSASTRQPGVAAITDLTPSVFSWRATAVPRQAAPLTGVTLRAAGRGPLPGVVAAMIGLDTAEQVRRSTAGWFFLCYGGCEAALFALIAVVLRGPRAELARRRVAWYTAAAAFTGSVPAGTFLAGLAPWPELPHPALLLYGLGVAWAAVIAAAALAGPWRRQPFGPPGFVAAVTLAVIAVAVMTGSRLQLGAPFGLSLLATGRYYGIGNNTLGCYATAGILTAAWAVVAARGSGPGQRRPVLAGTGVALAAVFVSGWPGFGAKVGGTIAMVPAFGLLLAAAGGARVTVRRGLVIAVSGLALVTAFAVADYLVPAIGASHLGGFVGSVLHGRAGGTLRRKIGSDLRSVTRTWYSMTVPVVVVVTGLMLAWPARLRLGTLVTACSREPLLRTSLFAVWLAVAIGMLADDSGVSVAATALPIALPLAVALVVRAGNQPAGRPAGLICEAPGISTVSGRTG